MRVARKRPLILKMVRAIRKRRHLLRKINSSLASAALAVFVVGIPFFVVWDIQNLSHDEPIEEKRRNNTREDPTAALSDAREELARMMKDKKTLS